jgi:hypothetical protein
VSVFVEVENISLSAHLLSGQLVPVAQGAEKMCTLGTGVPDEMCTLGTGVPDAEQDMGCHSNNGHWRTDNLSFTTGSCVDRYYFANSLSERKLDI